MAWDVLTYVSERAWDVLSGVTKTAWDVLSGMANLCGMFLSGGVKNGMGCFVPECFVRLRVLLFEYFSTKFPQKDPLCL